MGYSNGSGGMVVLAVDDEEPALAELAFLLDADPTVHTVLTASDADEALRILHGRRDGTGRSGEAHRWERSASQAGMEGDGEVDAVFLDIRMPGLDGLELASLFSSMSVPPSVVFVTANEDRAVDAYEVGAVDYLLKPVRTERLAAALHRILAIRAGGSAEVPDRSPVREEVIPVELAGTTTLVPRSAVRYVEAHGDYARLHTDGGSHLVRIPLSVLEDRWHEAGFLRIHRSYLVAQRLITALRMGGSGQVVRIDGGGGSPVELPVSRRHLRQVRDRLRGSWRGRPVDGIEDPPDGPRDDGLG